MTQLKQACWIVWGLLNMAWLWTLMCLTIFPSSWIAETSVLLRQSHESCMLCGMTRAFGCIVKGNFHDALTLNRGSVYLFVFLVANLVVFIATLVFYTRRKKIQPCNRSLLLGE